MKNAPQTTKASDLRSNGEDLDVVLGRFQAWAEVYRSQPQSSDQRKPATNPTANRGPFLAARPASDARDISYEEALQASRRRRSADVASIDPLLQDLEPEKTPVATVQPDAATSEAYRPTPSNRSSWQPTRFMETVQALAPEPSPLQATTNAIPKTTPAAPEMLRSSPPTIAPTPSRDSESAPAIRRSDVKPPAAPTFIASAATAVESAPPPGRAPRKSSRRKHSRISDAAQAPHPVQPAFRDVLRGTAALAAASKPASSVMQSGKSISLTLRVSDAEQARIQACAARANLSVSAYLRQCAMGVDDLREQVEVALSSLQPRSASPASPPGISAIPAILGRFAVDCFRRLRHRPEDYTVVSLR